MILLSDKFESLNSNFFKLLLNSDLPNALTISSSCLEYSSQSDDSPHIILISD
ncbi:unnamed protein product [Moneuplotes crassus]|uniref:Uncharacterized protein n=1 Tax=Euplotes crassus TaxID=5936 RepID=A0AAD1XKH3_EUPCR|nr:unnamed protein product [Moneuplotes crassus]